MRMYELAVVMGTSTPPVRALMSNLGFPSLSASSRVDADELPPLFLATMKTVLYDTRNDSAQTMLERGLELRRQRVMEQQIAVKVFGKFTRDENGRLVWE